MSLSPENRALLEREFGSAAASTGALDFLTFFPSQLERILNAARAEGSTPPGQEGWLPLVLCPTDGVDRTLLLPDGREVVGAHHNPSGWRVTEAIAVERPVYEDRPRGGFLPMELRPTPPEPPKRQVGTKPGVMHVSGALPEGVYPTHFRPNDTVYGNAAAVLSTPPASPIPGQGGRDLTPSEQRLFNRAGRRSAKVIAELPSSHVEEGGLDLEELLPWAPEGRLPLPPGCWVNLDGWISIRGGPVIGSLWAVGEQAIREENERIAPLIQAARLSQPVVSAGQPSSTTQAKTGEG